MDRTYSSTGQDANATINEAVASGLHVKEVRAYKYRMPLKRAYGTARGKTRSATNFIIHVIGRVGSRQFEGFGESQPRHRLTGDGARDGTDAWHFLAEVMPVVVKTEIPIREKDEALIVIERTMSRLRSIADCQPSDTFGEKPLRGTLLGIEVAYLDLVARAMGLKVSELMGERRASVAVSISTISAAVNEADFGERVVRQTRFPMTRFKGTRDIEANLRLLRTAAESNQMVGKDKPLWIDLNEALTFDQAKCFIDELVQGMARMEFPSKIVLEGPLPKSEGERHALLQEYADERSSGVPSRAGDIEIMPDESIWDIEDFNVLAASGGTRAINIKTPKAGGLLASLDLAERAVEQSGSTETRICIGGMIGTSDITAWAIHNLARSMPRLDYLTAVPPTNVETRIAVPRARYLNKSDSLIAPQTGQGIGTRLHKEYLRPYIVDQLQTYKSSDTLSIPQNAIGINELPEILDGEWVGGADVHGDVEEVTFLANKVRRGQILVTTEEGVWTNQLRRNAGQANASLADLRSRAEEAGVSAIITASEVGATSVPVLRVENTRESVWKLASEARKRYRNPVIGITGTAGKSTTARLLNFVLSASWEVHASEGNWNTIDGVAKTLSGLSKQSDFAVIEAAGSGFVRIPGWSTAEMIAPDIALITSVGEAHADLHTTLEETARLKSRLFRGMSDSGTAILNLDAAHSDVLLEEANRRATRVVTYGADSQADICLISYDRKEGVVSAEMFGKLVTYRLGLHGLHNALNSLAVLAVLESLGLNVDHYLDLFGEVAGEPGRGLSSISHVGGKRVRIVDQSFNANPLSMQETLHDFALRYDDKRRVLVLGEMGELGESSERLHLALLKDIEAADPALVFLAGPEMERVWSRLPARIKGEYAPVWKGLVNPLVRSLRENDVVFVKGSHSVRLDRLIRTIRRRKLEREFWYGVVQGSRLRSSSYCSWFKSLADADDIRGWIRHRSDGSVEFRIWGSETSISNIISLARRGPRGSVVSALKVSRIETEPTGISSERFRIRKPVKLDFEEPTGFRSAVHRISRRVKRSLRAK